MPRLYKARPRDFFSLRVESDGTEWQLPAVLPDGLYGLLQLFVEAVDEDGSVRETILHWGPHRIRNVPGTGWDRDGMRAAPSASFFNGEWRVRWEWCPDRAYWWRIRTHPVRVMPPRKAAAFIAERRAAAERHAALFAETEQAQEESNARLGLRPLTP
jgi:hypothetical protein